MAFENYITRLSTFERENMIQTEMPEIHFQDLSCESEHGSTTNLSESSLHSDKIHEIMMTKTVFSWGAFISQTIRWMIIVTVAFVIIYVIIRIYKRVLGSRAVTEKKQPETIEFTDDEDVVTEDESVNHEEEEHKLLDELLGGPKITEVVEEENIAVEETEKEVEYEEYYETEDEEEPETAVELEEEKPCEEPCEELAEPVEEPEQEPEQEAESEAEPVPVKKRPGRKAAVK